MSNLEQRVEELERRLALLEARTTVSMGTVSNRATDRPPSAATLVTITISNKRYDPEEPDLGTYEPHIWFDCAYTLSKDAKPTRAVKGVLEFADLFGEIKFSINLTLNDPLVPGKPLVQPGIGFSYNQFLSDHQWMMATELKDMRYSFKVLNVIYVDGLGCVDIYRKQTMAPTRQMNEVNRSASFS